MMMADDRDDGAPPTPAEPEAPSRATLAGRVRRFDQTLSSRTATVVRQLPFGVARLCPDLPKEVYSLNEVEVTRPAAVSEILSTIEPIFADGGFAHRRLSTYVAEVAWTLTPALTDLGWTAERLLLMLHDGVTAPPVSPLGFEVVDLDRWAPAARGFAADHASTADPAVQDALAARDCRLAERVDLRLVLDRDGMAGCHVYRHGRTAQIEAVNVRAEARGQGLGQGLMAAAMAQCADADVVFLVADADDWPQHWYRRLGFDAVAASWAWLRTPDPT